MSVRRHAANEVRAQGDQQTIEVGAVVLMGHGKFGFFQQLLELLLRYLELRIRFEVLDTRPVVTADAGQHETRLSGTDTDLFALNISSDFKVLLQSTADIKQFACWNRQAALCADFCFTSCEI